MMRFHRKTWPWPPAETPAIGFLVVGGMAVVLADAVLEIVGVFPSCRTPHTAAGGWVDDAGHGHRLDGAGHDSAAGRAPDGGRRGNRMTKRDAKIIAAILGVSAGVTATLYLIFEVIL